MNGTDDTNGNDGANKTKAALKIVFGTSNLGKEGDHLPYLNPALPISTLT